MSLSPAHEHPAVVPQPKGSGNGRYYNNEDNPSDPKRYRQAEKGIHLFLLTIQLDEGAIDSFTFLVLDLCSGLEMRWGVPLNTSGPRPNCKDSHSEKIPIMMN